MSHSEPQAQAAGSTPARSWTTVPAWVAQRVAQPRAASSQDHLQYEAYRRWPLAILAMGAFVAIWGGWVDLGRMAGFGPVNLLPGIVDLYVDLAITLPLGMEVYSAYALGVWLTHKRIRPAARTFAGWSVLVSLIIGAGGQVAYHLLSAAGIARAPWQVVVVVACVPVAVMGMGAALAHLLNPGQVAVAAAPTATDQSAAAQVADEVPHVTAAEPARPTTDSADPATVSVVRPAVPAAAREAHDDRAARDARILALAPTARSERDLAARAGTSRATVRRVLERHGVGVGQPTQRNRLEWHEPVTA